MENPRGPQKSLCELPVPRIRSYVLRSRMTPAQKKTHAAFPDSGALIPAGEESSAPLDLPALFPFPCEKYIVEIGFGMGKALALMAQENPAAGYVGVEVHTPGVARLLWEIENRGLKNVRIIHGDAAIAVRRLSAASTDAFHIFFPDPWPKKRHNKRRLLSPDFLRLLSSRLVAGGYQYIITDWEDYAAQVKEALAEVPDLRVVPDPCGLAPWRPETAFEKKGRDAGRSICEIFCVKINASATKKIANDER